MKHSRRTFLKLAGTGVSAAMMGSLLRCSGKKKPNIIFILADDLGYGDLGCYGQSRIKTPSIDRLSEEGIRFTDHYAGSTVCAPSRCCLMTGFHTGHARIRGNSRLPLKSDDRTVASYLKEAGYATALIGKWGLGEEGSTGIPNRQGFDYFYGYLNQRRAHNYYPDFLWRNTEKVSLDNKIIFTEDGVGSAAVEGIQYSHDLFVQEAISFIEDQGNSPFFLYLALTIPHANNESWLVDRHGMEVPDYGTYENEDWPDTQKGIAAMITRMDSDIGRIMETLKRLGLDEDTIVFFSSDNGPHREGGNDPEYFDSNGPLRGIKRDLYEGGIRVPLIVRWPGKIKPAEVCDHVSAFWDFLPTACELAGITCNPDIDGISYMPVLLGRQQAEHDFLYWEFSNRDGKQAVRAGTWKGIRQNLNADPNAPVELYNLREDPGETVNLAVTYPGEAERMMDFMRSARTFSQDFPFQFETLSE